MAPNLRSLRSSSRTTSSRPVTPQDAPATVSSTSGTEPTRPRKQRRTGRNARVAVDSAVEAGQQGEASGSGEEQQQNNAESVDLQEDNNTPNTQSEQGPWVEPTLPPPKSSILDVEKNPFLKAYVASSMQALGTMPSAKLLRAARATPARSAPGTLVKGKKRALETDATENGDERPKTATPSADGPVQTDSSRAEGSEGPVGREARVTRSTRSTTDIDNPIEETPAAVNGHGPALSSVSTLRSRERLSEIVEAAIARADSFDDLAVSRGLRKIWNDSITDPFLLTVLDAVLNSSADARQKSVFQTVMRDANRSVQAERQTGEAVSMARTQSATSTSSLSSAKSLDPETFAPTMTSGTSKTKPRAKGKVAKAAAPKSKGKKGRAGPTRSQSAFPTSDVSLARKRALEEDPDFSEEAVTAKRRALEQSFPDAIVDKSDVRTLVGTSRDAELPVPSPHDVERRELDREATGAGIDLGFDVSSSSTDGVRPAPRKATATAVQSEEIDNNDFCRECNGSGQLLCCDGCVNSFHFSCLDPPVNPDSPPEGQWFCPACAVRGPFGVLLEELDRTEFTLFALPASLRTRFEGVREEEDGGYDEVPVQRSGASRIKVTKASAQEMRDSKGKLIVCFRCRQTSDYGRRPVILCDYCPCSWHLDCLDPPRANPPHQKTGNDAKAKETWRCPNHIEHDLAPAANCGARVPRRRRTRDPQIVDVDVVVQDSDADSFLERDTQGTVYRVSERGLILNFVDRVKRDAAAKRARDALVKPNIDRQKDVVVSDESNQGAIATPGASNTGATSPNAAAAADAATSSIPSAEHEAAMNLVTLSQSCQNAERVDILIQQMNEVEELRSLQEMIDRRIQALNSGAANN